MPRYSGFVGPSYTSQSVVAADDRTVNWIPAKIESGTGAADYVFDPAPGFSQGPTNSGITGAGRASYTQDLHTYAVIGTTLVETIVSPTPTITSLVAIGGSGPASITGNGPGGHQILAANGTNQLWYYDTTSFASGQILTVTGHIVAFLNGYFLALDINTATVYFSALEDGTSWDALDAFQRSDAADKWQKMIVRQHELLIFGFQTISAYYVSEDPATPFVPNQNVLITRGIRATASLAMLQNSPIWLADDGTVRYLQGYTPVRVSTHAVEYAISQYSATVDADGFTYDEQGHSIYVLNFPSGNASWGYDLVTGLWHERGAYNAGTGVFDILPVCYGSPVTKNAGGHLEPVTLVLPRGTGTVKTYYMSQTYATEIDGTTGITRQRRAPQIVNELKRIIYDRFQLFMEVGTATASGAGSTPTVLLQWSNDGGQTFNTGVSISAGLRNAYSTRVIWRKLGMGRQRVFQISANDPIAWRLVDAFIEYHIGAS